MVLLTKVISVDLVPMLYCLGKIQWQTNAFYRGPRVNAQTETDPIASIDLALSKDFLKDENLTISLNVRDFI